jgi:hypothetical protein
MMNVLPISDELSINEWFVILSILIFYPLFILLKGKFPVSMIIMISLFSATMARIADYVLAGPRLDLYDLMNSGNYDLFDFIMYLLYMPFAYTFLYIYEKLNIKGIYVLLYIVVCSIFGVVFEWITVLLGVFTFKEWKSIYSFPVYLFIQSLTILYYRFLKQFYKKELLE